ncbi:P-loop containing nucleoside triphosphate hydrolase [Plasmopara halstedii]|uniref:p-loop containing nucleoside triphosphate hydrolase n=1 Tax=Plasmopara halstedii TaxID=4781 RepID=A0A0P1AP42_PLAHL|nr:P-loop containing nucleoside triphosphate hydrolase [Plasmopara halstedii]CEG43049.1 P-loop containing nucleoside triphosphate hydrolase [Plasmopara halstedii]|eukprot:XP_024579418.1 P-loop containing nucleoside triphosphate hydrolase [Plasmopara halstedii]
MIPESKVIVVALEGSHGCGKTVLCNEFATQGYIVLDEAFMSMPAYSLHPQSLLMETLWVCSWFERVLRLTNSVEPGCKQVIIADRSPYSAVLYSDNGHLLEPVIREQMREVQNSAGVRFYMVHVRVERELLWRRICARLEHSPERFRLREHKRDWMDETLAFYEAFDWDLTVTNDERSVATIAKNIRMLLSEQDDTFRIVSATKASESFSSKISVSSPRTTGNESRNTGEELDMRGKSSSFSDLSTTP